MENLNSMTKITVNNFPDSVRENPDVYISGSKPPLSCFSEILDNSVDEAKAGFCTTINVAYDMRSNMVVVQDDGRGIPVAPCDDPAHEGYSQCEVALTVLSAGGKFGGENGYKEDTAGKNGMGSSCVNALSDLFICEVMAGGKLHQVIFEKGLYTQRLKPIKDVPANAHGTTIKYILDKTMASFSNGIELDPKDVLEMCQQKAFLNSGLKLNVVIVGPEGQTATKTFCYENGLKEYLELLLQNKKCILENRIYLDKEVPAKDLPRDLKFSVSFTYTEGYSQDIKSFVNSVDTEDGGTHVQGVTQGICQAVRRYGVEKKKIKEPKDFEINDTIRGVTGIVAVKYKRPTFDRQSKTKLDMPKVKTIISKALADVFYDYLEQNPKEAEAVLEIALKAKRERERINKVKAEERGMKNLNPKAMTLGKLANCTSRNPEECELYLVEGDSAGGSCKKGRDNRTQAILPIFGKIPNVIKDNLSTVDVLNDKIRLGVVVAALGCGIGDTFDISKIKYHKIIPLADADADGSHIQIEWICFFWKYMPEVIKQGYLWLPQPPLFRAVKKGQQARWFYTTQELQQAQEELKGWDISRFKGLGEMEADQLWDTTLNPETRKMHQVTIGDAVAAESMIELCMGKEVGPRKEMIMNTTFAA